MDSTCHTVRELCGNGMPLVPIGGLFVGMANAQSIASLSGTNTGLAFAGVGRSTFWRHRAWVPTST